MEQFTGCEASPKSLLYTYIGTMHGALGTSFSLSRSLSLSSSHVTSHKHWHTDRRILSLYPVFLPRLNRLFVFLYNIQFNNWQSDSTRLDVLKKKSEFPVLTPSMHTTEITAQHHAEFKQWGNSAGDSVTSDSDRLRFFFSVFSPLCFYFSVLSE